LSVFSLVSLSFHIESVTFDIRARRSHLGLEFTSSLIDLIQWMKGLPPYRHNHAPYQPPYGHNHAPYQPPYRYNHATYQPSYDHSHRSHHQFLFQEHSRHNDFYIQNNKNRITIMERLIKIDHPLEDTPSPPPMSSILQ
jgi:hypothetical protein